MVGFYGHPVDSKTPLVKTKSVCYLTYRLLIN
jgi:hypothetical protein